MKKYLLTTLFGLLITGGIVYAGAPFLSRDLAPTPANGKILSTDGTNSSWITNTGGGSSLGQSWEIGGNGFTGFLAPTTTQKVWIGQASSTLFSANTGYFNNILATSTTATSTFMGNVSITDGTNYGFVTGAQPLQISGTVNLPYQMNVSNKSTGGNAMSGYNLANANTTNNANPFADVYYSGLFMAGSGFSLYPGLQPNDLVVVNSDAQVNLASLSSTTGAINLAVNPGFTMANYDARLLGIPSSGTASWLVGTTTGAGYTSILHSTTTSQLALSNGAGIPQWTFRNAGGYLYISTTTVAGTATTSTAALTFEKNTGKMFSSATSTLYSINATTTSVTSGSISKGAPQDRNFVLTDVGCMTTAATSLALYVTMDGVNNSNTVTCTTTWNYYPLTVNNTGVPGQNIQVVWQTKVGNPGDIIANLNGYKLPK